jgi:hypothetical protein
VSDIDLKAIKERCEKATKGPWHSMSAGNCTMENGLLAGIAEVTGLPRPWNPAWVGWQNAKNYFKTFMRQEDADFVAHAREDIPALLAEVATARKERDDLKAELRDVLCCVSQIFNGWRGCEEWSKWDEDVSQRVVAIQKRIDVTPDNDYDRFKQTHPRELAEAERELAKSAAESSLASLRAGMEKLIVEWRRRAEVFESQPKSTEACEQSDYAAHLAYDCCANELSTLQEPKD